MIRRIILIVGILMLLVALQRNVKGDLTDE